MTLKKYKLGAHVWIYLGFFLIYTEPIMYICYFNKCASKFIH